MNHRRVTTSLEVYVAIYREHEPKLAVFSSYSNPRGDDGLGPPGYACMMTEWGLPDSPIPLIGTETRWQCTPGRYEAKGDGSVYWLCVPTAEG